MNIALIPGGLLILAGMILVKKALTPASESAENTREAKNVPKVAKTDELENHSDDSNGGNPDPAAVGANDPASVDDTDGE